MKIFLFDIFFDFFGANQFNLISKLQKYMVLVTFRTNLSENWLKIENMAILRVQKFNFSVFVPFMTQFYQKTYHNHIFL